MPQSHVHHQGQVCLEGHALLPEATRPGLLWRRAEVEGRLAGVSSLLSSPGSGVELSMAAVGSLGASGVGFWPDVGGVFLAGAAAKACVAGGVARLGPGGGRVFFAGEAAAEGAAAAGGWLEMS